MTLTEALGVKGARWAEQDLTVAQTYEEMRNNGGDRKAIAEFLRIAAHFYPKDELKLAIKARAPWDYQFAWTILEGGKTQ